jgi:ribosomal protein L25 (general stress protein Ctc)
VYEKVYTCIREEKGEVNMKRKKNYTKTPEKIFSYGENLPSKYKFTEDDIIRKLNKKIAQSPIYIDNGNQIRELNRSI